MRRAKRIYLCLLLLGLEIIAVPLRAQTTHHSPRPTQLVSARKVFLSCDFDATLDGGIDNYDHLYAALEKSGLFILVTKPSEADLILQFSFVQTSSVTDGRSFLSEALRLKIFDSSTSILLWTLAERVPNALRESSRDKNFETTTSLIVTDLRQLTNPQ